MDKQYGWRFTGTFDYINHHSARCHEPRAELCSGCKNGGVLVEAWSASGFIGDGRWVYDFRDYCTDGITFNFNAGSLAIYGFKNCGWHLPDLASP